MADNKISVTWHGHSCFTVEAGGYSVVMDPYEDGSVPGLSSLKLEANLVLCSHEHKDHNFREGVTVKLWDKECPFAISYVDTFHDDQKGALRGKNRIYILEYEGLKVVHMGDIGCDLTPEQAGIIGKPDVLLIPVGGYYTIGPVQAKEIADRLEAVVTVPMHYRSQEFGYDVIGTLEDYTKQCGDVTIYKGNCLQAVSGMKKQTAVLTYKR